MAMIIGGNLECIGKSVVHSSVIVINNWMGSIKLALSQGGMYDGR